MKEYYNKKEAAKEIGISIETLFFHRKEIPLVKIDGKNKIPGSWVLEQKASRERSLFNHAKRKQNSNISNQEGMETESSFISKLDFL